MEIVFGICLGIGLAAACGFRIFVPLLVMSIASRTGHLALGQQIHRRCMQHYGGEYVAELFSPAGAD